MAIRDDDLVKELLDNGLVAAAFFLHGVDLGQQLRSEGAQFVQIKYSPDTGFL